MPTMSKRFSQLDYPEDYDLGDKVSFLHEGQRLVGIVVRVYNARDDYHVEVEGVRNQVNRHCDEMRKITHG
jgi:hypothetical protein